MTEIHIGKKNIAAGWILVLLAIVLGVWLEIRLAEATWGTGDSRILRKLLKDAHAHALCLAFLNILYGLTVDRIHLPPGILNQGAWLAIIGGYLFPAAMVLTIVHPPLFYATYVAAFFLFISLWIIIVGSFRLRRE